MQWLFLILKLYPRAWRERYEQEMIAVLQEHNVTVSTLIDILLGALDARMNYSNVTEGVANAIHRLRFDVVMTFCAFMLFGVGWSLLQRITDPMNFFAAAAGNHPQFTILFTTNFIIGCISFLAFLVGGLPVFSIAVARAFKQHQKSILLPFWSAASCLAISTMATAVLADWHHIHFAVAHVYAFIITYCVLLAVMLVIGSISVSLVISRTEFRLVELKWIFVPKIILSLCMLISVVSAFILMISIRMNAPQLFQTQDVGAPIFIAGVVFMSIGTILAAIGMRRGTLGHVGF